MAELKAEESTQELLVSIEGAWDNTPKAPEAAATAPRQDDRAEPTLTDLDSGWDGDIDDLFTDEPEEDDEGEELPDERLDPVAYAAAKKAREERSEAKRERRRMRLEAKRAHLLSKRASVRSKQKQKQKPKPKLDAKPSKKQARSVDAERTVSAEPEKVLAQARTSAARRSIPAPTTSSRVPWRLVALLVVVFISAAAAIAVFTSR